jgi:hypothetical protein
MGFAGVRSPQQDHIGIFNFTIRTGPPACSEYRRQTGDAGGVSSPVAAINIVRAHDAADELLRGVVQFISGLGATEHAKIPRIVLRDRPAERSNDAVQGFIPRSGTMRTVLPHQRLGQSGLHRSRHNPHCLSGNRNTLDLEAAVRPTATCGAALGYRPRLQK